MPYMPYDKPYLTLTEQVDLLRSRGMRIHDPERASALLHRIGYYRLSGYCYPFRDLDQASSDAGGIDGTYSSERYKSGTSLSLVAELYVFDKKLRLLFLDALERVEVGLRVEVALLLGREGAYAYRRSSHFKPYFSEITDGEELSPHRRFLAKVDQAFARSNEEFARHFRGKYLAPLPIWMAIELWDFGTLSSVLQGLKDPDLDLVASMYEVPRRGILKSWAQCLNYIRNICAHHGRLWNRALVEQPSVGRASEIPMLGHLVKDVYAQRRLYAAACVLQYLMRYIHPTSTWSRRLHAQLNTLPESPHLNTRQMGFPARWYDEPLWLKQS